MSKVVEIYTSIQKEPFIAIEFLWAIALITMGVYFLLPGYEAVPSSVFAQFVNSSWVADGIGWVYLAAGLVGLHGCLRQTRRLRNISTTLFFMCFIFTVLIRILTFGFVPTLWVWPLLLAIVAAIDNWNLNWKRYSP